MQEYGRRLIFLIIFAKAIKVMRPERAQTSIKSSPAIRQHFEMKLSRQGIEGQTDLDTPPPKLCYLSGELILDVDCRDFEEGLTEANTNQSRDSFIKEKEENEKLSAIRQTITGFSVHLACCILAAINLLNLNKTTMFSLFQFGTLGLCLFSVNLWVKAHGNSKTWAVCGLFLVFSVSLPGVITLGANISSDADIQHLLFQLLGMLSGMCLYAFTTKYEEWSSTEELVFATAPNIFVSALLGIVFTDRYFALTVTSVLVFCLGVAIRDCSKETLIPASSLEQRLSDIFLIYRESPFRLGAIAKTKIEKLIEKPDIV